MRHKIFAPGQTPAHREAGFAIVGREAGFAIVSREAGFASASREASFAHVTRAAGFTLVELLVVLAILGLLTTVVVVNVLPMQGRAQVQKAKADIALVEQGLELFRLEVGRYPTTEEGLAALTMPSATGAKLKKLPNDPWGRPYIYQSPGPDGSSFLIQSLGADGQPEGEGDNADLKSGA